MKSLQESLLDSKTQITESLFDKDLISKDILYHPKTKEELIDYIKEQLKIQGPDANLNIIDVSKITSMNYLFFNLNIRNIDISNWNMSRVRDMSGMFNGCENFNSDLSKWDVSKVEDMYFMFYECASFNSDLSKWNVSNVKDMAHMFYGCEKFNSDLSEWNVSKIKNKVKYMRYMFDGCKSLKKIPSWYHL